MSGPALYRWLLGLFPPGFRAECSDEAAEAFEALWQGAPGRAARARLLARSLLALPGALIAEWATAARAGRPTHTTDRRWTMRGLGRQMRVSVRTLLKAPGFTATATLLVALGVGAVTTIFTLVDHVLLRPLPYPAAERLVLIENGSHSGPLFDAMQGMGTVEAWAAAYDEAATLLGTGEPMRVIAARVSGDFFRVFGARPALGRLFDAEDFGHANERVVVDGRTWQRVWGGDPGLVGSVIQLDGRPVTVIGVTDPAFSPPEALVDRNVDVWRPVDRSAELLTTHTAWVLGVVGRVAPGASVEAAGAELESVMGRMATVHENYRDQDGSARALPVTPLAEVTVQGVRAGLGLLLGAVTMLLLVACANVAQLFLARGLGRGREMAVRRAMGAGTGVLVGQLLLESLLVGLVGGALGVGLAWLGLEAFLALSPNVLPRQDVVALDLRVLGFAVLVSIATSIVFGLLPAVRSVRGDVADELRASGRSATASRGTGVLRSGLIVAEVGMSLVLVAGAGLLMRSFLLVHAQEPGVRIDDLWTVPVSLTSVETSADWNATTEAMGEALAGVPGVRGVTWGLTMPLTSQGGRCCWRSTVTAEGDRSEGPYIHPVTPSYFDVLGTPLRAGRVWTAAEAGAEPVPVVVSEALAVALWGSPDAAVNRSLSMRSFEMTVVGVAADVRHYGLADDPGVALHVPVEHLPFPIDRAHFAVQVAPGATAGLGGRLREAIWSAAPAVPVPTVRSMDEWVALGSAGRRFDSTLFATFASVALLLAAGGLYGTLLYLAGQRRRELGIRLALGASRGRIEREVLRGGLALATFGVALGLFGAWASGRFLESRLWGVDAGDPLTLATAATLLLSTAALASWLPARRAARTDPVRTLRVE